MVITSTQSTFAEEKFVSLSLPTCSGSRLTGPGRDLPLAHTNSVPFSRHSPRAVDSMGAESEQMPEPSYLLAVNGQVTVACYVRNEIRKLLVGRHKGRSDTSGTDPIAESSDLHGNRVLSIVLDVSTQDDPAVCGQLIFCNWIASAPCETEGG
jgi:hypothetical protein